MAGKSKRIHRYSDYSLNALQEICGIDNQRYYLQDLSQLLTALQTVVDFYD
jgi:hypothetical protein